MRATRTNLTEGAEREIHVPRKLERAVRRETVRISIFQQTNQLLALVATLGLSAVGAIEVKGVHVKRAEEEVDEVFADFTDPGCLFLVVEDSREKTKPSLPIRLIFHVLLTERTENDIVTKRTL